MRRELEWAGVGDLRFPVADVARSAGTVTALEVSPLEILPGRPDVGAAAELELVVGEEVGGDGQAAGAIAGPGRMEDGREPHPAGNLAGLFHTEDRNMAKRRRGSVVSISRSQS